MSAFRRPDDSARRRRTRVRRRSGQLWWTLPIDRLPLRPFGPARGFRYHSPMTSPGDTAGAHVELDSEDQDWLEARLIEYQELLAYLRDH